MGAKLTTGLSREGRGATDRGKEEVLTPSMGSPDRKDKSTFHLALKSREHHNSTSPYNQCSLMLGTLKIGGLSSGRTIGNGLYP